MKPVPAEIALAMVEGAPDGLLAFDLRCRYTAWNRAMRAIWGLPEEVVLGRPALEVFPFLREIGEDRAMRAALSGEYVTVGDRPFVVEQTGRRGWYQARYSPLRDSTGRIIGGLGQVHDVSARKAREDSLRLQVELSDAAARAGGDEAALLAACVDLICRLKGWPVGQAWLVDSEGVPRCHAKAGRCAGAPGFRKASLASVPKKGLGLVGRVWARGGPVWTEDLAAEAATPPAGAALKAGLRAGFALPVFRLGRLYAVLAFHGRRPRPADHGFVAWSWGLTRHLGSLFDRTRLDRTIAEIEHGERLSLGQDLNDSLGQTLTGGAMLAKRLAADLGAGGSPLALKACELADLLAGATGHARRIGAGLSPAAHDQEGLHHNLVRLAQDTESRFQVACVVESGAECEPVAAAVAAHLYRIAEEAVLNAVKHGSPRRITVALSFRPRLELTVRNDGLPLPGRLRGRGMGLPIMEHRSRAIGARLKVGRMRGGGALVRCTLPPRPRLTAA